MSNKVQQLFDKLVEGYNLRAIKIGDETWYAMNDLPLDRKAINMKMSNLRKSLSSDGNLNLPSKFEKENTRLIKNSEVNLNVIRNFDKVNNTGETFGNFAMINYIIMTSRLGHEYKIEMIKVLDEIRKNDFYVDNNISNENLQKLKDNLIFKTEVLKKCYGNKLLDVKNVSKKVGIPLDFIMEHMEKNGWITKKHEVTKKGAYGKVIKHKDRFYLSEEGIKLIQTAYTNIENTSIRKDAIEIVGEDVFK